MMMAATVVLMLVAGNTIVKRDCTRESAIGEKFEGAVDGGETDVRILLLDQAMKFVGREMLARLKKRPQDRAALPGLFESNFAQVLQKDSFGFADVGPGNRRLIVDPFLQHRCGTPHGDERTRVVQVMILGESRLRQPGKVGMHPSASYARVGLGRYFQLSANFEAEIVDGTTTSART